MKRRTYTEDEHLSNKFPQAKGSLTADKGHILTGQEQAKAEIELMGSF